MRSDQDAMLLVRADLCERLEAIRSLGADRAGNVAMELTRIRTLAAAYGLEPVVRLADAWRHAADCAPGGAAAALYLDRLRDAIGCARLDDDASEALLASVSVRLSA